jgi:Zn-dependent membrane protease YugP
MIFIIVIFVILIIYGPHLWAKQVLKRYNKEEYFSGNGIDLAKLILTDMNINGVKVEVTDIGDHYDPENKVVRLTPEICGRKTLTAVVVAAHEVGHAMQDYDNFKPLRARTGMIRIAVRIEKIGAVIIFVVPFFAFITRIPAAGLLMFFGGFATLCIPLFVHMLTLPTEFDASFNRALPVLSSGKYIPEEDISAARKILLACALTYVANALAGLLNIWRWIRILRR